MTGLFAVKQGLRRFMTSPDALPLVLSQGVLVTCNLIASAVIARTLGPVAFGRFVAGLIIFAAAHHLALLGGVDRALRQDRFRLDESTVRASWIVTYRRVVRPWSVFVFGSAGWLAGGTLLALLAAASAGLYYWLFARQVFEQAFGSRSRVQVAIAISGSLAALSGAITAATTHEPSMALAARLMTGFLGLLILKRVDHGLGRMGTARMPLGMFTSPLLLGAAILLLLNNQRTEVIILRLSDHATSAGVFAAAAGAALFMNGPLDALHMNLLSRLGRVHGEGRRQVLEPLLRKTRWVALVAVAAAVPATMAFRVLYGSEYYGGTVSFVAIYLCLCLRCRLQPALSYYLVLSREQSVGLLWLTSVLIDVTIASGSFIGPASSAVTFATLALAASTLLPLARASAFVRHR